MPRPRGRNPLPFRRSELVQDLVKTPRRCLQCNKTFGSYGPGNRLCITCGGGVPPEMRRARGGKRIWSGADVEAD